jgi:molybdopterin/thiamine biosynthesis adenylyltransferase
MTTLPSLTDDELERYARHIVLPEIGGAGQRRLKAARVLVVGAGGLGAPVLAYLAAAGVGTLGIVDNDAVSLSNLQRQVIHGTDSLGRSKADSARDAILRINPHVQVELHRLRPSLPDTIWSSTAPTISRHALPWLTPASRHSARWCMRRSAVSTAR